MKIYVKVNTSVGRTSTLNLLSYDIEEYTLVVEILKKMKRCKGRCLTLAISQGKVGEEIGDGSSRRKYCAICEIYFGLWVISRILPANADESTPCLVSQFLNS